MESLTFNFDAFSSGQVGSKIWLIENLERVLDLEKEYSLWLYGSWYGTLPLMIFIRNQLKLKEVTQFDVNKNALHVANFMLDNWHYKKVPMFFNQYDVNLIDFEHPYKYSNHPPDIIINTSVEHMPKNTWWENIPQGTIVALQACDMKHKEHINNIYDLENFKKKYQFSNLIYANELFFDYQNENSFKRFMLIGIK